MASESPVPLRESRDLVDFVFCFGPFTGSSFASSTNAYIKLPFLLHKDFIVDDVGYECDAQSDLVGNGIALGHVSGAAPTGALAAAARIHANVDPATIGLSPATVTGTSDPFTRGTITPATHNNIILAGEGLYLWTSANEAASALAGLVIHVRGRTRRK